MMENQIEKAADYFKAISDPNRLKILRLLAQRTVPVCVNAMAASLGITQSAVSQHLKILRQQGFVAVTREGSFKHYSLNPVSSDHIKSMFDEVIILKETSDGKKWREG